MNIAFFGSSKFVIPILEALYRNFTLSLVLTTENPALLACRRSGPAGRPKPNLALQGDALQSYLRSYPVVNYCIKNKIPYRNVSTLSDSNLKSLILNLKSSVAILADFGLIIPQEILNAFPKGILNIHPSLLPKYRGPTPVQTAILEGEKETGVSIMKLDEEIDHGPILTQTKEQILENDTSESLYERLFLLGAGVIVQTIELYVKGKITPYEQDHKKAIFTKILKRKNGFIDVSNLPSAEKLQRMIRAYFPWPGVWTRLRLVSGGQSKIKIVKFLPENKIQIEGKKPMSYKDFINGYPNAAKNLEFTIHN